MEKKLLLCTLSGIIFTILIGTLSHFFYEWSGKNFYIGLIAPVNESVWEHMKMVFFPMLFYCGLENQIMKKYFPSICQANTYAIFIGTFSIPVLFFTYTGVLGKDVLFMDIAVFCISVILAFLTGYRLSKKRKTDSLSQIETNEKNGIHLYGKIAVLLLLLCFILFTLYPPDIGLFQVPEAVMVPHGAVA